MSTPQIAFPVQGMSCPTHAVEIERVLNRIDGIIAARVNYATACASIAYDPERATGAQMVAAIAKLGFAAPLDSSSLTVNDLPYATSARTIEKVLERAEGVVRAQVELAARRVTLQTFPEYRHSGGPEQSLRGLGFVIGRTGPLDAGIAFALRCLILVLIAFFAVWSAIAHAGYLGSPDWLHAPTVVIVLALVAVFAVGWPFYRFAFDALLQDEWDVSIMLALVASTIAIWGMPVGMLMGWDRFADIGFVIATTLTAGWFVARAGLLWRLQRKSDPIWTRPILSGVVAALAMLSVYVGILTLLQSFPHALEQLATDWPWVGLVALGFGGQIGLYAYLRAMVRAAQAAGATAVTGAGTGT